MSEQMLRDTTTEVTLTWVDLNHPPQWLFCPCADCESERRMIGGYPLLPVCECGTILATLVEDKPMEFEDCPFCTEEAPNFDSRALNP